MQHISAEIARWALLILGQVYLLKYRLFVQRIDKIGAALCITMAAMQCIGCLITDLIHDNPDCHHGQAIRVGTALREVPAEDSD